MSTSSKAEYPMLGRVIALTMAIVVSGAGAAEPTTPLALESKIPLGKVGGRIDHLAFDQKRQRLFVAELGNDSVGVVDLAAGKTQRTILGLKEPQGIAYEPASDSIFVANGGDGSVLVLRAEDLTLLSRIELGADADNVRVDPAQGRVAVGYGKGALAILDATRRTKLADIQLRAHPEGFQLAASGTRAFVNVPDAREIQVIDLVRGVAIGSLPTETHRANFPMAVDEDGKRVFVAFRSPARLLALGAADRAIIADLETCGDADDVFFDSKRRRIYVVCGEGLVDVFEEQGSGFARLAQVPTSSGARTGLFVPELDGLFVAARAGWIEPAAVWVFRAMP